MPASLDWSASRMPLASSSPIRDAELRRPVPWRRHSACRRTSRMPMPNSALSSNSELDQAGRGPVVIEGVGSRGQVAAVDGRATGGVRDHSAVAEQLGEQFDVGRFAATGAGPRELKQRLQELDILDLADIAASGGRIRAGSRKKSQLAASGSRSGACASMLMALRLGSVLSFTGQTLTQRPQPVQSSGAT